MTPLSVIEAELFIRAEPARIAAVLADPGWQAEWSGGLRLYPYADRGPEGMRSVITGVFTGSCEWWIEPVPSGEPVGAIVHFWLRPAHDDHGWWRTGPLPRRRATLHRRNLGRRWRSALFRLKDALEPSGRGATANSARIPGSW